MENKKLVFIENLLYLLSEINFKNGFPYFNQNYGKRRKLFKPLIANTIMTLIIIRDIISLFITEDYSILIGDFVFKFEYKLQWNLTLIDCYIVIVFIQIDNHFNVKNNQQFCKILATKLIDNNDGQLRKIRIFLKLIEVLLSSSLVFCAFNLSFLFLWMESTLTQLMTFGVIWSIIFSLFGCIIGNMFIWNLIYFLLFCYYSRFLLKIENQKLKILTQNCIKAKYYGRNLIEVLKEMDVIHRRIKSLNEIWSLFLLFCWIGLAILMAIFSITVFFSQIKNVLINVIFIFGFILVFGFISTLTLFCSSVELEAKKTYNLLTKLNVKTQSSRIFLITRLKVRKNILK